MILAGCLMFVNVRKLPSGIPSIASSHIVFVRYCCLHLEQMMAMNPPSNVIVDGKSPNVPATTVGQASGWAAVEKAVHAFDEEQVKDCKEDIDTLLTFAGLFSAAITGLLALSYNLLQEDSIGESLMVLRQISNQTAAYILYQGVMLNTTDSLPSPPPPFVPSTSAILVNSLWFASLILSLATASIGILVKQWLREYMSCKVTTSAQGRLRLRHFRAPGLATWKVYEIAAILPLLIQLALGLFFIGLCAFTVDAHPTVGRATFPLVIAWALFFIVVTISPIFSTRCPYKTPLLIGIFSELREYLFISKKRAAYWMRDTYRPYDEPDAVKYDERDLEVLVSADALQSNDELLGSAMKEAFLQTQPNMKATIDFVLHVLHNRLQESNSDPSNDPCLLNLQPLTRSGRTAVIDILSMGCGGNTQSISKSHDTDKDNSSELNSPLIRWVMCILLSPSRYPLPQSGLDLLCKLTSSLGAIVPNFARVAKFMLKSADENSRPAMLADLLKSLRQDPRQTLSRTTLYLKDMHYSCLEVIGLPPSYRDDTRPHVLNRAISKHCDGWGKLLKSESLDAATLHLLGMAHRELSLICRGVSRSSVRELEDAVALVITLISTSTRAPRSTSAPELNSALASFVRDLFDSNLSTLKQTLLRNFLQEPYQIWAYSRYLPVLFKELAEYLHYEIETILVDDFLDSTNKTQRILDYCFAAICILRQELETKTYDSTSSIWSPLCNCLAFKLEEVRQDFELSKYDKDLIVKFHWEISWSELEFKNTRTDASPVFSDYFVSTLMKIYTPDNDGFSYIPRIHHLRQLSAEARAVAEGSGEQNAREHIAEIKKRISKTRGEAGPGLSTSLVASPATVLSDTEDV